MESFNPSWARNSAIACGEAISPARMVAGSPVMRTNRNIRVTTMSTTGTEDARRVSRKRNMVFPLFVVFLYTPEDDNWSFQQGRHVITVRSEIIVGAQRNVE